MDNNEKKPNWRDKIGSNAGSGSLPKLADKFDEAPKTSRQASEVTASGGIVPPPPASERAANVLPPPPRPAPAAQQTDEPEPVSNAQSFAERLRARREAAERAGTASADNSEGLGGGLHLRPAPVEPATEENPIPAPPPPPSLRPAPPAAQTSGPQLAAPMPPPSPVAPPANPPSPPLSMNDPEPVVEELVAHTDAIVPAIEPAPEYDYSSRARASVEVDQVAPPQMAPPAAPSIQPGPQPSPASAFGAAAGGQQTFARAPSNPPSSYQDEYGYEDQRYSGQIQTPAARHPHDRGYDDDRYTPAYGGGRATASDYEDAYNDYDDEYFEEPRSKRGPLMLFLGLAAIGVIAAGLIFWFTQNQATTKTGTAPPVVSPQAEPVKIAKPTPPPAAQSPQQTKLFYDRIVGEETVEAERIVPREEKPLDPAQNVQQVVPQPAANQPAANQPAANQPVQGAGEPVPLKPLSPGELVPGQLPVPLPPPLPGQSGALQSGDPLTQTASSQSSKGSRIVVDPASSTGKQSLGEGIAKNTNQTATQSAGLSDPAPPTNASAVAPPPIPRAKPLALAKLARDKAAAESAAVVVSNTVSSNTPTSSSQGGPLNLSPSNYSAPPIAQQPNQQVASLPQATPPAPAPQPVQQPQPQPQQQQATPQPAPPANSSGAGGYVVQLASYRDAGSARNGFQDMKSKHPGLLGKYQPFVSESKVGSFGTFYRLQVGPIASAQSARQICSSLLAAGEKDCIVKQR